MSASGPYRLRKPPGDAKIAFSFNRKKLYGIEGDTVASALLANGVE